MYGSIALTKYGNRPMMPTLADEQRSRHQCARLQILLNEWDEILADWIEAITGTDKAQIMGIPDTSMNSLQYYAKQLSTPGLYGRRPTVRHSQAPQRAEALVGPGGLYDQARVWSKMVFVQFLALGLGDIFVRWDVDRRGRFGMRVVWPHDVFLIGHPDNPDEIVELWELRRRWHPLLECHVFTWDVYSVGHRGADGKFLPGKEPSYRIYEAVAGGGQFNALGHCGDFRNGGLGEDVSNLFIINPKTGEAGPLIGDDYPWWGLDGEPELPWGHWKDTDTGMLWNTWVQRGAHRGALNVALYWTYAGFCARDATGSTVFAWGMTPQGVDAILGDGAQTGSNNRSPVHGSPPLKSFQVMPNSVIYHDVEDGKPHGIEQIGPGVNLDSVKGFAADYAEQQRIGFGIGTSASTRKHANPTSGTALAINKEEQREHADQVRPVFEARDQRALRNAAIVARVGGLGTFPEDGYTWEYHRIPRTADEKQGDRDELDWQKENGLISEIGQYMRTHPGTTEQDALLELVRVSLEEARLAAARSEALAAAGFDDAESTSNDDADAFVEE